MSSCARAVAASLVSAFLVLGQSGPTWADTVITTDDGKEYAGDVVVAGVNTITMKLSDSGYQIVPTQSILSIRVDIQDSSPIEGKLIDWSDGEVTVRVGDRDVAVRDGIITSVIDVGVAAGGPVEAPPPQTTAPAASVAPAAPAVDVQPTTVAPSEPATLTPSEPETVPSNATM